MNKELKPVRCGCGVEARTDHIYMDRIYEDGILIEAPIYRVYCRQCGISTPFAYLTESEAVTAWNRAMSGSAEKSSTVERTAKAEYSNVDGEYLCSECGRVVQIEDAYCCGCGARLEWDE